MVRHHGQQLLQHQLDVFEVGAAQWPAINPTVVRHPTHPKHLGHV